MRRAGLLLLGSLALCGCNRAPDEPPPPPPASAVVLPAATGAAAAASPHGPAPSTPSCVVPMAPVASPAPKPAAHCPKDPEGGPPFVPVMPVKFPDTGASVDAELARTPAETERGLMFRTHMAEERGMLFFLEDRSDHTFWMHNTCIPLDMLFIDEDGTIVGVVENAPTLNDETRSVGCPSRYVLEVNAGWTRRHGVKPGQKVILPKPP